MIGKLISINDVATDIKEIKIKLDRKIRFISGQYVMLAFEDKSLNRKAYSILSYEEHENSETSSIVLLVKIAGEFTHKLFHSQSGDTIYVYGPYGKFFLKDNHKNIFIAGGIGIVPIYSIFKKTLDELNNSDSNHTHLYYSCRFYNEMALYEELKKLNEEKHKHLHINFYFTREGNMDRFNVEEIKTIKDHNSYDYYICGPDNMMDHITDALKNIGVDEKQIHKESFVLENM